MTPSPSRRRDVAAETAAGHVVAAKEADDALMGARAKLAEGVDDLVDILRQPELMEQIPTVNRDELRQAPHDHEAEDRERDRDHSRRVAGPRRGPE